MISRIFLLPFLVFGFQFSVGSAQEVKTYARSVIDTLCSPSMHGRGYVNDGDKIAAEYIRNEFKKAGLVSLSKDYYQHFTLPVNTFPGNFKINLENLCEEAMDQILIKSYSSGITGKFDLIIFDSKVVCSKNNIKRFYKNNFQNAFVVVDSLNNKDRDKSILFKKALDNPFNARGIIILKKNVYITPPLNFSKGPWDVSTYTSPFPVIEGSDNLTYKSSKKLCGKVTLDIDVKNEFIPSYPTQNIIGKIEGSQQPDSFLVFTAHYDHLGRMGKDIYFPGANDNASGVAMLLNLAKFYSKPENKPKYSMLFIAFGAEEAGLVGSKYFVEHPLVPLNKIKFLINMDLMGTGDEGMMVVNGAVHKEEYEKLVQINKEKNYLPQIKARGKAANSDHYFFSEAEVKCFFFYTLGGIKAYHDIYDRPETLPLTKFEEVFMLVNDFVKGM